MKNFTFLHWTNLKSLIQMTGNSTDCDVCNIIISVRGDHCDYKPQAPKNWVMPLSICNHISHTNKPIIVCNVDIRKWITGWIDGWTENCSMLRDTETGITHNIKLSKILTFLVWNVLWFPLLMQQHIQMRISHGSFHVPPVPIKVLPLQSSHVCSIHTPLQHVTAARKHM